MNRRIFDIFVNIIAASFFLTRSIRCLVYRSFGINVPTISIRSGCYFATNKIKIGKNSFINYGCCFLGTVEIGKECSFGPQVMLCASTHEVGDSNRRAGEPAGNPIKIKDGCWIGTRTIILPGVTIGEGCVIAAGSVVIKNCEPNCMYAGVPARKIKELK